MAFFEYTVFHPIDFFRALSQQLEVASRLGEFKLALNAGGVKRGVFARLMNVTTPRPPITEEILVAATAAARNVSVDFSRAGQYLPSDQ